LRPLVGQWIAIIDDDVVHAARTRKSWIELAPIGR